MITLRYSFDAERVMREGFYGGFTVLHHNYSTESNQIIFHIKLTNRGFKMMCVGYALREMYRCSGSD